MKQIQIYRLEMFFFQYLYYIILVICEEEIKGIDKSIQILCWFSFYFYLELQFDYSEYMLIYISLFIWELERFLKGWGGQVCVLCIGREFGFIGNC